MADAAMQKIKDLDSKNNSQLGQFGEEVKEERDISLCGGIKRRAGWLDRWREADLAKKEKLAKMGSGADLSNSVIILQLGNDETMNSRMRLYAKLLHEEVWENARVRWEIIEGDAEVPSGRMPVRLLIDETITELASSSGAAHETYRIDSSTEQITIKGASQRAVLFGVGRLLREMVRVMLII